jgi:hypothetical protein
MKAICPDCQSDLRYVESIKSLLCNDCGFSMKYEPNPIAPQPVPPSPQTQTNPIFQKYKSWKPNSPRFLFLGLSVLVIAVMGIGVKQIQRYQIAREIDAEIAKGKELIAEIKRDYVDIKDLPQVCWPRKHIHLTYKMFTDCFIDGVTYYDVVKMIGSPGRLVSQNGSISIYQWGGVSDGLVTMSFNGTKLIGKNQVNLESNVRGDDSPPE